MKKSSSIAQPSMQPAKNVRAAAAMKLPHRSGASTEKSCVVLGNKCEALRNNSPIEQLGSIEGDLLETTPVPRVEKKMTLFKKIGCQIPIDKSIHFFMKYIISMEPKPFSDATSSELFTFVFGQPRSDQAVYMVNSKSRCSDFFYIDGNVTESLLFPHELQGRHLPTTRMDK